MGRRKRNQSQKGGKGTTTRKKGTRKGTEARKAGTKKESKARKELRREKNQDKKEISGGLRDGNEVSEYQFSEWNGKTKIQQRRVAVWSALTPWKEKKDFDFSLDLMN